MKKLLTLFIFFLFIEGTLSATTPYNLEGLKSLNILILDLSDAIPLSLETRLAYDLKKELEKNGIQTTKDGVGAMFVKMTTIKQKKHAVVYITLGIGEEATIHRDRPVESFVVTYNYDDMIETDNLEVDVYDSVMNFLLDEFLEQLEEDNE